MFLVAVIQKKGLGYTYAHTFSVSNISYWTCQKKSFFDLDRTPEKISEYGPEVLKWGSPEKNKRT